METEAEPTLVELIRYNNWANREVIAACQKLDEGQLEAAIPGCYGTVRETLAHIIRAEANYVERLTGQRPIPAFKREDRLGVEALAAYAAEAGEALLRAVQQVPLNDLVREVEDGKRVQYQKRGLVIQVINHGVEHRTNITTLLNQAGLGPPEVDGWAYMWAHQERFEVKEEDA
jgi:uncharacterized damage-inducible protein DinB